MKFSYQEKLYMRNCPFPHQAQPTGWCIISILSEELQNVHFLIFFVFNFPDNLTSVTQTAMRSAILKLLNLFLHKESILYQCIAKKDNSLRFLKSIMEVAINEENDYHVWHRDIYWNAWAATGFVE